MSQSNEQTNLQIKLWNGIDYKDGSWVQYDMGFKFLNMLDLNNKVVIDAGCGTGKISYEITQRNAKSVIGFDLSENMILTAKETYPSTIICPERNDVITLDFVVGSMDTIVLNSCDIVTCFFVIHWIGQGEPDGVYKKENAIINMYKHLNNNGEFLFTVITEDNRIVEFKTINQTCEKLVEKYPYLRDSIKTELELYQNLTYDTNKLKILLHNLNCKILRNEIINFTPTFKDRKHLEKSIRPLIFGQPFMKLFPIDEYDNVFNTYVDCLVKNLEENKDCSLNYPMSTTLVHIKKS